MSMYLCLRHQYLWRNHQLVLPTSSLNFLQNLLTLNCLQTMKAELKMRHAGLSSRLNLKWFHSLKQNVKSILLLCSVTSNNKYTCCGRLSKGHGVVWALCLCNGYIVTQAVTGAPFGWPEIPRVITVIIKPNKRNMVNSFRLVSLFQQRPISTSLRLSS